MSGCFPVQCPVWAVLVVDGPEPVELGLQLGDAAREGLFAEPKFQGLMEPFDLPLGSTATPTRFPTSPEILADLREDGEVISRKTVPKVMRRLGLRGSCPKRWRTTTITDLGDAFPPDVVKRSWGHRGAEPGLGWRYHLPAWRSFPRGRLRIEIDTHCPSVFENVRCNSLSKSVERK